MRGWSGALRKGPASAEGGACTREAGQARGGSRAGLNGERAESTWVRSHGLPASGLCRVDSCVSAWIPITEGGRRRTARGGVSQSSPAHGDRPCPPTYTHQHHHSIPTPAFLLSWEPASPICVPTSLSLHMLAKHPTREFLIKPYFPLQSQMVDERD